MDDHYFETLFTARDGTRVPPKRFRTLQGAMADEVAIPEGAVGVIWYQGEPGDSPVEVVRYNEDGTLFDVQNDDGTNFPLNGVTEDIDPGPMDFSLWLEDPDGHRVAYDFGFCWDGEHSAEWQCSPGDSGRPFFRGTITWSNCHDFYNPPDEEDYDDLGDDLQVTYSSGEQSGEAMLEGAAVISPIYRDAWVEVAEELFAFLRGRKLI